MKVLVTGGCGYVGSTLVPELLRYGHEVDVYDIQWFGSNLPMHEKLTVTIDDIRVNDLGNRMGSVDAVIHLAAVANDPCGDLDPKLTWEINALATMRLSDAAARAGVKQFIYASSGSVYGVSDAPEVTEDLPCVPLSEYNKTKMVAERAVLSYWNKMDVTILRPATVCGVSARTRLDVAVNALTIKALTTGKITVFGGDQVRPNIHIDDMVRAYLFILDNYTAKGIFNAGFENMTIMEIAMLVQSVCGGDIVTTKSNDPRSYRLNSDKLSSLGFAKTKTVRDAIVEMKDAYHSGKLMDTDNAYNLHAMPR